MIALQTKQNEGRGQKLHGPKVAQTCAAPSLAARAIDAVGTDSELATDEAVRLLTADRERLHELLPQIVRQYCRQLVLSHLAGLRVVAIEQARTPSAAQATARETGARLRSAVRVHLMDYPLPNGGKRLGEATAAELAEAAAYHRGIGMDALMKARWFTLVAEQAGDRRVQDALTEAQLQQLMEQANAQ